MHIPVFLRTEIKLPDEPTEAKFQSSPAIGFSFLWRSGVLQGFQLCEIVSSIDIVRVDP